MKTLYAMALLIAVAGCSERETPIPIRAGTTIGFHWVAPAESELTASHLNPDTGEVVHLEATPVVSTADIASLWRARDEAPTVGSDHVSYIAALRIELTPAGAKKCPPRPRRIRTKSSPW